MPELTASSIGAWNRLLKETVGSLDSKNLDFKEGIRELQIDMRLLRSV